MTADDLSGGVSGALVRCFDWSGTGLGALSDWPDSLRTCVDIVLNAPVAMLLMWGPERVLIFNDACVEMTDARHPATLGGTAPGLWPEIGPCNGATRAECELMLLRGGHLQQVSVALFCTPVRDASAAVAGVLCTLLECPRQGAAASVPLAPLAAAGALQERLAEEHGLFRALFEQAPCAMALVRGPEHTFDLANRAYHALTGQRELIGKPLLLALPELRGQELAPLLDALHQSGIPASGKLVRAKLQQAGGAPRLVDFTVQPIRPAATSMAGIAIEGVDVSARCALEERQQIFQQAGGIGSFEWFPETGKMAVSATYRRLWGLADEQDVTADLLASLIEAQDHSKLALAKLGREANPLQYVEYRIRRPDNGELRWIARQGSVVIGAAPLARRYVGVAFDVTERKLIEHAFHASQERLAAIFGQAAVGLSELDLEGRFQRVNGAMCNMLGRSEQQLLALNMNDIIHPDDASGNSALMRRLVETGASFAVEKRYLKPDGSCVWVASNVSRLVDEQGRPQALISVKTDITEARRIEAALRELNDTLEQRVNQEVAQRTKAEDALRQSQKMEAVGQLTGGIAHDFNNVLQIIRGNLQLLHQTGPADGVTARRLETAIAAVERGAKLSAQLLAFARRQPLRPVVADLGPLVANMEGLLRPAVGESIQLRTVLGRGLWNTLVDPGQIENVILNLAINARDAMAGQGKLSIELGNAMFDAADGGKSAEVPAGQYVLLSVSDTGRGMAKAVLQRAFEPFFTTKAEGAGAGLGLSMAYGFVKQSGGHIRIHSEPGRGTTVDIYLPRSLLAEAPVAALAAGPVVGGSDTILVVDDDAGVQATVVDMLAALGYHVLKADDGESALTVLRSGTMIDLLLTDVVMPGPVRSPDLVRLARELWPDIAVVYTSGYPQDGIVHDGRLDAGVELLSKPYGRADLARTLRRVLAQRQQRILATPFSYDKAHSLLAPETPAGPAASSLKILVVEDNLDSQQMVCELVGMLGHTVIGVSDAEQALDTLREQDFDILFTDVSLPGMSGISLARDAIRNKPSMRIIFSTGYGKESLAEVGFEAHFLRKPYDLMELRAALEGARAT